MNQTEALVFKDDKQSLAGFRLDLGPVHLTDQQFFDICQFNPGLKLEQDSQGQIVVMAPTGGDSGWRNFEFDTDLGLWNRSAGRPGKAFDSSTIFILPSKAKRGPDAAWIRLDRWLSLTPQQRKVFPPICPDFVMELRSESDSLSELKFKMREWLANGARLAWLIDPIEQKTYIYRQGQPEPELLEGFDRALSGEDVMPGFVLPLQELR